MNLHDLDDWMFKGLGGIINMIVRRVGMDHSFGKNAKRMLDNEVRRLQEAKTEVDARQSAKGEVVTPFCVIDTWFIRSYEGINHWFDMRTREGPPMDKLNLTELEAHILRMQEIVDNERARRNRHDIDAAR